MPALSELSDRIVEEAVGGSKEGLSQLSEALLPHVRGMIMARLAPKLSQLHAVDEILQHVMMGLTSGIGRLENRTVGGLKGFVSGIVRHQVSLFLAGRSGGAPP